MSSTLKDQTLAGEGTLPRHDAHGAAEASLPRVSIVIPCYNEERYIGIVLENLQRQYPIERSEIIVVDGKSEDGTRGIVEGFIGRPDTTLVRLIDNPARNIPTALNLGIKAATGEIIIRMDAHSVPSANYVRRAVEVLEEGETEVVGMPWRIAPGAGTPTARAIALAVAHPFGIGDAKYRATNVQTQYVDTVPFGVFRKSLWTRLGGFNEELLANEDYDFYYRVRRDGGRVLLDAAAHSTYFARPTLKELAKQYARYGGWKAQMVKLHPESIRPRQVVAPAFVLALIGLGTLGLVWRPGWLALLGVVVAYAALALWFGFRAAAKRGEVGLTVPVAFVFFVLHVTWGGSFLRGLLFPSAEKLTRRRN